MLRTQAVSTIASSCTACDILFSGQRLLGTSVPIRAIEMPGDLVPGDLNVIDLRMLRPSQHRHGELSAEAGAAARAYVERATIDALQGRVAGLVTMPMNKEATQLSDPRFVGHTEMIAELCGITGDDDADEQPIAVTVSAHCVAGGDRPGAGRPCARRHRAHRGALGSSQTARRCAD
jgi:hypothetical protein